MSQSGKTTDHGTIQEWVEERDGRPSVVEGTEILRIDFDGPSDDEDDRLKEVSWEEFFEIFEDRNLCFLYQKGESRFNKFIER